MIEKTKFWIPPVPFHQHRKTGHNTQACMACVVDDRLFHGLRFEGEMLMLTPDNWQEVITYGCIDFLLVESIWRSTCGIWFIDRCRQTPDGQNLIQVVEFARKKAISTVFWMTRGYEYHEMYQGLLDHFDYVFSTDPKEVEVLTAQGRDADYLPPCIQPAVHHPFRPYNPHRSFGLNVLYDGLADLEKQVPRLKILKEIQKLGLSIIESRRHVPPSRLNHLSEYRDSILGCTTRRGRILALQHANTSVTFDATLSTPAEQQWMTLEAAGCGLPVVHQGSVSKDDVRKCIAIECGNSPVDLLIELVRFQKDPVFRERMGHIAWRQVHQHHTFSHRIRQICEKIHMGPLWEEFPKVSVIVLAKTREQAEQPRNIIEQQTYPNIETVVLVKNRTPRLPEDQKPVDDTDNFCCIEVTDTLSDSECMYMGHMNAKGTYHFRMDCEDNYGPHYIADMIFYARCLDARIDECFHEPVTLTGRFKLSGRNKGSQMLKK
jgi:hypothetical protein